MRYITDDMTSLFGLIMYNVKRFLSILVLLTTANIAHSQKSIVEPEWQFSDDFETLKTEFWGHTAWAKRGEVCPGDSSKGKSIVFTYKPDTPEAGNSWAEQRFEFPIKATQIEISYDLFIPSNYYRAPKNHKNIVFWSGEYGMVQANIGVSSESWPEEAGGRPSIYVGVDGKNYGHSNIKGGDVLMPNHQGAWQRVQVYLELATQPGDYGRFEIYRNQHVVVSSNHPNIEPSWGQVPTSEQIVYSTRGNYIDQGYLLGWANGGFSEDTVFCIDNFEVKARTTVGDVLGESAPSKPGVSIKPAAK